jgi:hypothetical protein
MARKRYNLVITAFHLTQIEKSLGMMRAHRADDLHWISDRWLARKQDRPQEHASREPRLGGSTMPCLVLMIAAQIHDLFTATMFGAVGASPSLLFALLLPETVGRKVAVIEGKAHG